ncbi:hypothetical protein L3X38_013763 [Prunus dulcis]|uniref:Uncharacterized protein n=1 Tax=Prunus dulcis TaxID=3755 RepID=A0AAD4WPC5_PRUDU|nr:hypothetical protein L3X38_013763 [Prunus dulcis]
MVVDKAENNNHVSTTVGEVKPEVSEEIKASTLDIVMNGGVAVAMAIARDRSKHSNMASALTIATESEANKGNIKSGSSGHNNGNYHRNGSRKR